jgi:hypothetical protein
MIQDKFIMINFEAGLAYNSTYSNTQHAIITSLGQINDFKVLFHN